MKELALAIDWRAQGFWPSLLILTASFLGARALAYLLGRLLAGGARRTATLVDDRLVEALKRPLALALFLPGAFVAAGRLPLDEVWGRRLYDGLAVAGAALLTIAGLRAYGIVMAWYTDPARPGTAEGPAREFGPLFSKAGKVVIVVLGTIAALQHLQVNVASLVVSLGVGSLAVGLAAQDTLANMFAGFTLMLDRPFRIGDRVVLATGEEGDVEVIGMRATRIRTLDATLLVVPNSLLVKERLVNRSRPTRHAACRLHVSVAYGTDLERARAALQQAALAAPQVEPEHAPQVLVSRFGESGVELSLAFWARDYLDQGAALSAVHEQAYRLFAQAGIEIPYPVRRIVQERAPRELTGTSESGA